MERSLIIDRDKTLLFPESLGEELGQPRATDEGIKTVAYRDSAKSHNLACELWGDLGEVLCPGNN